MTAFIAAIQTGPIGKAVCREHSAHVGTSPSEDSRSFPLLTKGVDNERQVLPHRLSITLFLLVGEFRVWSVDLLFPSLHKVGWDQQSAVVALRNAFAVYLALPMRPSLVLNRCEDRLVAIDSSQAPTGVNICDGMCSACGGEGAMSA